VWCLGTVRGQSNPWLSAIVASPLAFCWYVYMGLLPFIMTLPLFAFAMAVWLGQWNPVAKALVLWVLLITLFGFHVVGAAAAATAITICALGNVLLEKSDWRQVFWAGFSVLPVPVLVGVYLFGRAGPTVRVISAGIFSNVVDAVKFTCATVSEQAAVLMLAWVALLGVVAMVRWRDLRDALPVTLAAACLLLLSVIVPVNMGALWPAGPRLFPFALILVIATVNWSGCPKGVVAGLGLFLVAGLSAFTTQMAATLDQQFHDFLSAVELVQPGKKFLPILVNPHEGSRWVDPFWSLGSAYTVLRGGSNPYVFGIPYIKTGASPIRYRDGADFKYAYLYDPNRRADDYRGVSHSYDYVLLWGDSPRIASVIAAEMVQIHVRGQGILFARPELASADFPPAKEIVAPHGYSRTE